LKSRIFKSPWSACARKPIATSN